jgi:hypothetical protein
MCPLPVAHSCPDSNLGLTRSPTCCGRLQPGGTSLGGGRPGAMPSILRLASELGHPVVFQTSSSTLVASSSISNQPLASAPFPDYFLPPLRFPTTVLSCHRYRPLSSHRASTYYYTVYYRADKLIIVLVTSGVMSVAVNRAINMPTHQMSKSDSSRNRPQNI